MATSIPEFVFNNGLKVPALGFGCWMGELGKQEETENMVRTALKNGYRHFDTAAGYGNEAAVGKAIRESGIPREEIFVVTKLPNSAHHQVREALETSLKELGLEYLDLWLMHWPQAHIGGWYPFDAGARALSAEESPTFVETWREMEKVYKEGKVKAIGVSNFSVKNLEILLKDVTVVPATNQVELHPAYPQFELLEYCKSKGVILSAYSPLGQYNSPLFKDQTLHEIAEKENASIAQVLLSWGVQRETIVIFKTEKEERMIQNAKLLELSPDTFSEINNIHRKPGLHLGLAGHFNYTPGTGVFGWTYEQLGWDLKWDAKNQRAVVR